MLRFADPGGRAYTTLGTSNANLLAYWTTIALINAGTLSISSGTGRTGGSSIRYTYASGTNWWLSLQKSFDSQATWGIAFAFKLVTLGISGFEIVAFYDTIASGYQCELKLNTNGTLSISRNGTVLGTSTTILPMNVWAHIEFKATIHPSAGTAEVRLNGVSILSLTGQNTRNTANSSANYVLVGYNVKATGSSITNAFTLDLDDIIIYDGQTTDPQGNTDISTFIGDCGIAILRPSAAGTYSQFTPDSGVNYTRVNETTPDTTSYVESSTIGKKDSYAFDDLPNSVTSIKSVLDVTYVEKTDVGARQIGALLRSGGNDYTHPTGIDLTTSYAYYFRNWGSNPATTSAWTTSTVNALESGQIVNT